MAIKTSNQITFTEQKKILEIKEWYLATEKESGITINPEEGWTLEVQTINETKKYLWNYEEVIYSIGPSEASDPIIIGFYGKGSDGNGISDIKNYYYITSTPELPENPNWSSIVLLLTPTDKYLWNYEEFIYTDGSSKSTSPAIIGVYGDSGTDTVDFQIYSVDGFEFSDTLTSIELKTIAFQGGISINSDAKYQWKWWNSRSSEDDKYTVIQDATSSTLVVKSTDPYAFSELKCEITYNNCVYEDHVSLTTKTIIYTSVVKFFDGSNIFTSNDLYIVAYVDLYKNNERIESALDYANTYCTGISTVSSTGVIISDIQGSFSDDDTMYFICKNETMYDVILGKYTSDGWQKVNYNCKYTYNNSLYPNIKSNIIAISKESINKSQNIDFIIGDENTEISRTNVNIIDSNDPIISNQAPENPLHNQLWLDTSATPNALKIYNQSENQWIECNNYVGNTIYTLQPSSYSEGDLWILADGETCGDFGPGSMLKATTTSNSFNVSHWIDVDQSLTNLKDNINQYFAFDAENGLKIGQKDENFYVKISSTEMGFYDNSNEQHKKVVYISNETANIDGLTVEKNLDVDCPAIFNDEVNFFGFVWKKEPNGSLSLAIGN